MTGKLIALPLFLCASYAVDAAMRELATDAKLAMDRADLTQDWVARTIGAQPNKLSLQLSGQLPFTYFCRFACREMREETDFWSEFFDIQAARVNRTVVRADIGALVAKVDLLTDLLTGKKPIVKMELPDVLDDRRRA